MKLHNSTTRLSALLIAATLCLGARASFATLVEGFESGLGAGEAVVGDAGIQGNYFGIAAPQGSNQLLLTTINSTSGSPDANAGYTNQSGHNAVANSTLATFFGVSAGSIKNGTHTGQEGSGFTINLGALSAGQTISFNYDFLTQEPNNGSGNPDFAFYTLTNQSGTTVITDVLSAQNSTPGSGNPFGSQTNYLTKTISISVAGSYTLGIGVADAGSTANDDAPSALLVDNIQTNAAVPEPTTIAFCIAGAALLGALRTRIKRRS
jgi:hypothetical protein